MRGVVPFPPRGAHASAPPLAPPSNVEMEQALLGAVLLNNAAFQRVGGMLEPEHFSEPVHAKIFELVGTLISAGKVANPITLRTYLPADFDIGGLTVNQYLARLAAEATSIINTEDYAVGIRDLADRRAMLNALDDARAAIYEASADTSPEELGQQVIAGIDGVGTRRVSTARPALDFGQVLTSAIDMAARAYANDGKPTGIPTGLPDFDSMTNGLHKGEYLLLGARPSMGKSGVALSWALDQAAAGYNVYFNSLEMNDVQTGARALASLSYRSRNQLSYHRIAKGQFSPDDFEAMTVLARAAENLPIRFDQRPAVTVGQMVASVRSHARRLEREGKRLDVWFVDHLHLVRASDAYRGNRTQEVGEISGALKAAAKNLGVALVALAQLSRDNEKDERRPRLSDLRWAGELEQDADTICFLHRPDYALLRKLADADPRGADYLTLSDEIERVHNLMEFLIAKQRMGPIGTVRGRFDLASNKLDQWVGDHVPDVVRQRSDRS